MCLCVHVCMYACMYVCQIINLCFEVPLTETRALGSLICLPCLTFIYVVLGRELRSDILMTEPSSTKP